MKRPKMIGANAKRLEPKKHRRRDPLQEAAREFNAAFDEWARRRGHTHLVWNDKRFA